MASVWSELKRRNVIRVGIAYAVVAWLVIEIVATTFPILRLPEWTITFVTVLLIIGFPFSLVFAWAYELTPEGLKKEKEVDRSKSITHLTGRKLDFAIIGVLTVAVGYLFVEKFVWTDDATTASVAEPSSDVTAAPDHSIAVLPFVNMSADLEQEYFSDGITEEILNALAAIRELAVTSRTSAFAFKGKNVPIPEIAEKLGVAHVLEGSVRKSGTRLRVTAQLIDVATDKHLWSQTYDRELTDIFAMQDEISAAIAKALRVNLLGDYTVATSSQDVNPEAYDLYLHGRQQHVLNTYASLKNAENYYRQAIEVDPSFVPAYAGLGWALASQVATGSVREDINRPKVEEVLAQGLALDPDNGGLVGLSGLLSWVAGDLEQSYSDLSRALSLDPPHFDSRRALAATLFRLGRNAEALQVVTDWLAADPLDPGANSRNAMLHLYAADFDGALAATERLKAVAPDNPYGDFIAALTHLYGYGDLPASLAALQNGLAIDPYDHEAMCIVATIYLDLGDYDTADTWLDNAGQNAPEATIVRATKAYRQSHLGNLGAARQISLDAFTNKPQLYRWFGGYMTWRYSVDALIERGEPEKAVELLIQTEPEWSRFRDPPPADYGQTSGLPSWVGHDMDVVEYLPGLARALQSAGDERGAENVLAHLEAMLNYLRQQRVVMPQNRFAELYALRNQAEKALTELENAEKARNIYHLWRYKVVDNAHFDGIRDEPRYAALVNRVEAELQRQRAELDKHRQRSSHIPL